MHEVGPAEQMVTGERSGQSAVFGFVECDDIDAFANPVLSISVICCLMNAILLSAAIGTRKTAVWSHWVPAMLSAITFFHFASWLKF